jgi:uncharacterized protein (DUF433 family)
VTKPDLLQSGIYTVTEAAELVAAPIPLVRVWIAGRRGRQFAVIENQLGKVNGKNAISFTNLMELRFVALFWRAGVDLREIRSIMHEARRVLEHPHPFATKTIFRTDGRKIVAEIGRKNGIDSIYDLRSRNYEMRDVVMDSLKEDVRYDPRGEAAAWHPRKRLAPHVVVNPNYSFGQPVLEQSRIPTETLAKAVKVEGSARIVAELYEVPIKQVREAVAFQSELRQAA